MWQILQNNWNNNRAYIIKLIYINGRIYMLTIIQKLFNLTVYISHTYLYIYIYHPFVVWKIPMVCACYFSVHPQENDSREGKNLEFTSSDEDSFLMCAVLTPSFIICRWRLMLNSSYWRLKNETWKKVLQKKNEYHTQSTQSTREEKCVMAGPAGWWKCIVM